jgi:mannan endo-1,6-alpha-mannosidase
MRQLLTGFCAAGWEAGALMGAMVDYWYYTGDTKYNKLTTDGLLFQVGPNKDFMPPNQTMTEGNDDQGFWGMAAMSAAEYKFPDPPEDQPQWLALAQAVFNTQAPRWDNEHCGGGLRWQIFTWNNGFTYKNSISNACFFNIGARLALYTGNQSYADWAEKTWDWMRQVKFLDDSYYIYDGAHIETGCKNIVPYQFSYNAGAFLLGAAAMYNHSTGAARERWRERVDGLLNATMVFFVGDKQDIMSEVACEPVNLCNLDQQSFKAYLSRWMAATTKWAPWTYNRIAPLLKSSAIAAVSQCNGGANGRMCGLRWQDGGKWDGTTGVGQQMAVMEVVLGNMIKDAGTPLTHQTGGTSRGDAGAGGADVGRTNPFSALEFLAPITAADRAGAAILTILVLVSLVAGIVWMLADETVSREEHMANMRAMVAGERAVLRKRRSDSEKGKRVERSDSDGDSSRIMSVIEYTASGAPQLPPMVGGGPKPRNSASTAYPPSARGRRLQHRSVASDPGLLGGMTMSGARNSVASGGGPMTGAGYRQSVEQRHSAVLAAARRNSLQKKRQTYFA